MSQTENNTTTTNVIEKASTFSPQRTRLLTKNPIRYFGDVNEHGLYSPRSNKKALHICKREIEKLRREKKILQQQLSRMKVKIVTLEDFLKDLKEKGIICDGSLENLTVIILNACVLSLCLKSFFIL